MDVLGQWPQGKVETIRHAYIVGFPFLLKNPTESGSTTHFVYHAPTIFPGLKLDMLTVEDIWLSPAGELDDEWPGSIPPPYRQVSRLLRGTGWKELNYVSGRLSFSSEEKAELEKDIGDKKKERNEPGFEYSLSELMARPHPIDYLIEDSGLVTCDKRLTQAQKDENAAWELLNPQATVTREVQVRAKRGIDLYAQDCQQRSHPLSELLRQMTWIEARKSNKYLSDDVTLDPWALV